MGPRSVRKTSHGTRLSQRSGMGKDLLAVSAIPRSDILALLRLAGELKRLWLLGRPHRHLAGATLGLLFEKPSTRTRVSFQAGMNQLGGQALFLPSSDIQLSRGESIADTARALSRYLDGIVIRTFEHVVVEEWARESSISIINGLTDFCHPCQALSDLLTIQEKKGALTGLKIGYVGDGNNVAHSLIESAAKTGMCISVGCPPGYEPAQYVVDAARQEAEHTGGSVEIHEDPGLAAKEADVIYTDVWVSMGQESEQSKRLRALAPYQVNTQLVKMARPDAMVMHCLPAHRGQEITSDVLDGPQSVVMDQAENRLHMQKAILVKLLKGKSKR